MRRRAELPARTEDALVAYVEQLGEPQDPNWEQRALCAQVGWGDFWFPEKGDSNLDAKRVCSRCEVRAECLQSALDNDERFGVWAGLSERERQILRRRLRRDEQRDAA